MTHLVILGMGYSASVVAAHAAARGWKVSGTKRLQSGLPREIAYNEAASAIASATHLLISLPPENHRDPGLRDFSDNVRNADTLKWIGYYSTTGVYGNRDGGAVNECTPVNPTQPRSRARVAAEEGWARIAAEKNIAYDRMRIGGIYGPGRSPFEMLRSAHPRLVVAPGHAFSRIHRDDIAGATLAAIDTAHGERVLNFVDTLPTPQYVVIEEAARISGETLPTPISLEEALADMNPMARSFWAEHRTVDSARTCAALKREWTFPTYREGLADIWAQLNKIPR